MQWEVTGIRGGKQGKWKVEGKTEWEARAKATGQGVIVSRIRELSGDGQASEPVPAARPPQPAPREVEYTVAVAEEEPPEAATEPTSEVPQTDTVDIGYAPAVVAPTTRRHLVPEYKDITRGAGVLQLFGLFFFITAAITLVITALMVVSELAVTAQASFHNGPSSGFLAGSSVAVIWTIGTGALIAASQIAAGLLIRLLASVSLAVRDIARNSF